MFDIIIIACTPLSLLREHLNAAADLPSSRIEAKGKKMFLKLRNRFY